MVATVEPVGEAALQPATTTSARAIATAVRLTSNIPYPRMARKTAPSDHCTRGDTSSVTTTRSPECWSAVMVALGRSGKLSGQVRKRHDMLSAGLEVFELNVAFGQFVPDYDGEVGMLFSGGFKLAGQLSLT